MALYILIILGIVQGVTEFLPVSSSGHLVLFYNLFGIETNTVVISVIFHVATLFAVLFVYFKDILKLIKNPFCKTNKLIIMATLPTVVIALLLKNVIEKSFGGQFLIWGFLITAIILFVSEMLNSYSIANVKKVSVFAKSKHKITNKRRLLSETGTDSAVNYETMFEKDITNLNISYFHAVLIGIVQGLACFPGISRSGSTIACGLALKENKKQVADFSFLLSIPAILGSLVFELKDMINLTTLPNFNMFNLLIGFVCAFVAGVLCIKFMLKIIKKQKLYIFSIYLVCLSIAMLLFKIV